jgi:hypothetical protein
MDWVLSLTPETQFWARIRYFDDEGGRNELKRGMAEPQGARRTDVRADSVTVGRAGLLNDGVGGIRLKAGACER